MPRMASEDKQPTGPFSGRIRKVRAKLRERRARKKAARKKAERDKRAGKGVRGEVHHAKKELRGLAEDTGVAAAGREAGRVSAGIGYRVRSGASQVADDLAEYDYSYDEMDGGMGEFEDPFADDDAGIVGGGAWTDPFADDDGMGMGGGMGASTDDIMEIDAQVQEEFGGMGDFGGGGWEDPFADDDLF